MKSYFAFLCALLCTMPVTHAQVNKLDVPYTDSGNPRHLLDIYAPADADQLPVVFWIHGGGWQAGNKSSVQVKPQWFVGQRFLFVSTNYRLLPEVNMDDLVRDVAKSLGWVHKNIALHGGDPNRILVMGHSAGAQLAALVSVDDRYLKAEDVPLTAIIGCVPVDGDTYDIPAIITTAEIRQTMHGLPLPTLGHRVKFGNDPKKHIDFSTVTHVSKDKGIPPFLILYVAGHPDVTAQAQRLDAVLKNAGVPSRVYGARETTHNKLNDNLGVPEDAATAELLSFIKPIVTERR